jgi:hypothetical protein
MIALRQIQTIQNNSITIFLPAEFKNYQQAEVIILPFEKEATVDKQNLMAAFLNDLPENSEGLSRAEIEQHIQQERGDWDD